MKSHTRLVALLSPYVTIPIGLYVLESAWGAILLYNAGLTAIVVFGMPPEAARAIRCGWRVPAVVFGAVAGAGGGVLIYVLWPYIGLETVDMQATLSRLGLDGDSWWIFGLYFVAVHPLLEEAGWRVVLAPGRKGPHWVDVAFGGYHAPVLALFVQSMWIVVAVLFLSLAAWGWRWMVRRQGGLGVVLASHAAANLSIFMAATAISEMSAV